MVWGRAKPLAELRRPASTGGAQAAPLVVDALVANYAGDEAPSAQTQAILNGLVGSPEPMQTLGRMLWWIWLRATTNSPCR